MHNTFKNQIAKFTNYSREGIPILFAIFYKTCRFVYILDNILKFSLVRGIVTQLKIQQYTKTYLNSFVQLYMLVTNF